MLHTEVALAPGEAYPAETADIFEQAELWFEPGSMSCYHVHTYGFMLGEIVRHCSGMPFEEFFRAEIAAPLGADFTSD